MASIDVPGYSSEVLNSSFDSFGKLVKNYHADPAFRARLEADPVGVFGTYGIQLPAGIGVKVLANDDKTLYVTFPPDPNVELADEMLGAIAGGNTVGSAGTIMTASSMVCASAPSSASTLSSSGTASSS